jgi:DNA modification methylase
MKYPDDFINKIIQGDALEVLKQMPDEVVDTIITSPPYWSLRDYGVEGQIGLEKTPEEYVEKLVNIFREAKRVLKKTGTLWLNLGDSYAGSMKGSNGSGGFSVKSKVQLGNRGSFVQPPDWKNIRLKPKDLVGIPWRVAFALQKDGWYLRQDIIWAKPNPMPESVTDRCTRSHEYIFLLSKNPKYYFDNDAIKEPAKPQRTMDGYQARNKRDVWWVSTKPFKEAHFATFPEDLVEPMILAGCPRFVCKKCGKPRLGKNPVPEKGWQAIKKEIDWTDCCCGVGFEPGIVLDPFMGSGTTAVVAKKLSRRYIGIELNPEYIKIAEARLQSIPEPLL